MTLQSILGPLKKSVFLPFKKWILTLPIVAKVLILVVIIIFVPFMIIAIKRMINKKRNAQPQSHPAGTKKNGKPLSSNRRINNDENQSSTVLYFKDAKKLISKKGLKNSDCDLHILRTASKYSDASHLCKSVKIIELSDNIALALSDNSLSLLIPEKFLSDLEAIRTKLKLSIANINLHYDLSKISIINSDSLFSYIGGLKSENLITNIYTSDNESIISSFNQILGKENSFRLEGRSDNEGHEIINFILSKIVKSDESNRTKYACISILNKISPLMYNLREEAEYLNMNAYLFCILNRDANLPSNVDSIIKHPKKHFNPVSILTNTFSAGFSIIFFINIITELDYINNLTIETYTSKEKYSLDERLKDLQHKIDDALILSEIYPESIKYRQIYREYAEAVVKDKLIPTIKRSKSISELTGLLIYFIYIREHVINENTHKIVSIVNKITDISNDDLLFIIKYASNKTISQLIIDSTKVIEVDKLSIETNNNEYLVNYENEYLGISSQNRVNTIYKLLEEKLNKCTTQNLLSLLKDDESIPLGFKSIFSKYQKQIDEKLTMCDSSSMVSIASSISMINEFIDEQNVTNFKTLYENILIIIDRLEANGNKLKEKDPQSYAEFHKFLPILVAYTVNAIINSNSDNQFLPLVDNSQKNVPISFTPNFYKNAVSISPIYSKEYLEYKIIPLIEQSKELKDRLDNYGIHTSYVISFYNEAFKSFIKDYIKNYTRIVKQLVDQSIDVKLISNQDSLNFYLVSMSEDDYPFNIFINYYNKNTYLNNIDNKDLLLINKHFQKNDNFISSDKYKEYQNIFAELKKMIVANGYSDTYEKIKQGYEPLKKVYSYLAEISSIHDNYLYVLLKHHLDIAVEAIENIAIDNALEYLDKEVEADYFYLNSFSPFNTNSQKFISNKKLISYIGNSGSIYLPFEKYLKPILKYNKVKGKWDNSNIKLNKHKELLDHFNKIYSLNHLLLNKDGSPKPLNLEVTPIPSDDKNYIFSSFYIDDKTFVNSLNVDYMKGVNLPYEWAAKDTISIVLKLENGEVIQKNYEGYWSLFKAVKDAKYSDEVFTWNLNYKGQDYPVSFLIKSDLMDLLK